MTPLEGWQARHPNPNPSPSPNPNRHQARDLIESRTAMASGARDAPWDAPVELEHRDTSERLAAAERLLSTGVH